METNYINQQLKDFIYTKNGWNQQISTEKIIKTNLKGEKCGKLICSNGKILATGTFPYLQKQKKKFLGNGIRKDQLKITY